MARPLRMAAVSTTLLLTLSAHAARGDFFPPTLVLDHDTTIDAVNSYPEPPPHDLLILGIANGANGPSTVNLVEGGVIGGHAVVSGDSHLAITGGQIEALTVVCDQATLTMSGGLIAPLIRIYDTASATLILRLEDSATMRYRGGELAIPAIRLDDSSAVHFYGTEFRVNGEVPAISMFPVGVHVGGRFSDGTPFEIRTVGASPTAKVFLHTIPEPSSAVIGVCSISLLHLRRLLTRRTLRKL